MSVVAEAEDGHQQTWAGYNWLHSNPQGARKGSRDGGPITVYDSASLQEVPALLEPLNLKPSSYGGHLTLRVTKKFPPLARVISPACNAAVQIEDSSV